MLERREATRWAGIMGLKGKATALVMASRGGLVEFCWDSVEVRV